MKLVRGITSQKVLDLLASGTEATAQMNPHPSLLTIFQKVCDALAFAHSKGIIHRGLKPDIVMLDDFGVVLVMDWGLAKRFRIADCRMIPPPRPRTSTPSARCLPVARDHPQSQIRNRDHPRRRHHGHAAVHEPRAGARRDRDARCAQRRQCSDLSFLAESPALESLDCNANSIADLTPLRGQPLKVPNTGSNRIADLHPPAGLPLTELMIRNNPIADYAPLLELRQLQKLLISELSQIKVSLEPLRQHPSLQYIALDSNGPYSPAAEF